jgi:hypothetical protein
MPSDGGLGRPDAVRQGDLEDGAGAVNVLDRPEMRSDASVSDHVEMHRERTFNGDGET